MSDTSKCQGINCPAKEKCERYISDVSEFWQSWIEEQFEIDRGKFECEMFYGKPEDLLLIQMKGLMK